MDLTTGVGGSGGGGGGANDNSTTNASPTKKNPEELGLKSTKDMIWAKAYSHTWWPGWIEKKSRGGKVLLSFFESTKTLRVRECEISSFESDFEAMMSRKVGSRLLPAIESALSEFSRRLVAEMSCNCGRKEGEVGSEREGIRSTAQVLEFVKGMAVCSSFEEVESVRVCRAAAEVEVFRRYAFVKQDSAYEEAMRVAEMVDDTEDNKMSTSSKDKMACSMIQEIQIKDNEEEDDELEKELDIHKECVEQVKSSTTICKNNIKESPEQQHLIERSQVVAHQAFHPVEVLAFVRRMAISFGDCVDTEAFTEAVTLVNTFRRYAFIKHDWIYQETMRLSESTNALEANMNGTVFEDEQTCKVVQEGNVLEDENNQKLAVKHMKKDLLISKTIIENPLLDIVKDLYCLALDPFSGAKGHGVKNFDATQQKLLRYRELVYLKAINRPLLLEHTPVDDCVAETSKALKLLKVQSTTSPSNISVNVPEKNIAVNKNRTQKFRHLSNVQSQHNKKAKVNDAQLSCNTSGDEDAVKSVDRNVEHSKDTASCNGECESNRRQKTMDIKVCSNISDMVENVNISNHKRDIAGRKGESKSKKMYKANVCSKRDVDSINVDQILCSTPDTSIVNKRQKTDDVEVYCRVGNVECSDVVDKLIDTSKCSNDFQSKKRQKISTFDPAVLPYKGGSSKTMRADKSACANDDCHESKISPDVLSDHLQSNTCNEASAFPCKTMPEDNIGTQCEGDVADLCKKKSHTGIVSGGSSKGNQRLSKTTTDVSVKTHQTKTLRPMSGLYCSPSSAKSPTSIGGQVQSSETHAGSEYPATLHMKFPKDFKLPSKDELLKRFHPFGPIDSLKSKVFFYTGSAQVVFLRHLDAEAACQYAKRKKIFLGGVNVRFWLDQHEHSKRGANNISSPVSLPTTGSSLLDLDVKACLKISSPQNAESGRKNHHVKFPSARRDQPSYTTETTDEVPMQSDSVKCSKEVAPDISLQMIALLEKCNQIVTKVKDNIVPKSFYSVFSRSYCHSEFDDQ